MEQLQELLTDELRDLYDAEKQLVKALPKVAKAVTDTELSRGFSSTLRSQKTKSPVSNRFLSCWGHVQRASPAKR